MCESVYTCNYMRNMCVLCVCVWRCMGIPACVCVCVCVYKCVRDRERGQRGVCGCVGIAKGVGNMCAGRRMCVVCGMYGRV